MPFITSIDMQKPPSLEKKSAERKTTTICPAQKPKICVILFIHMSIMKLMGLNFLYSLVDQFIHMCIMKSNYPEDHPCMMDKLAGTSYKEY